MLMPHHIPAPPARFAMRLSGWIVVVWDGTILQVACNNSVLAASMRARLQSY